MYLGADEFPLINNQLTPKVDHKYNENTKTAARINIEVLYLFNGREISINGINEPKDINNVAIFKIWNRSKKDCNPKKKVKYKRMIAKPSKTP